MAGNPQNRTWYIAAPFIRASDDRWLHSFVRSPWLAFRVVPAPYDHDRSRRTTGGRQWLDYLQHSVRLFSCMWRHGNPDRTGIITSFPQLAVTAGLLKQITGCECTLVAWLFNLGEIYSGTKGKLARLALRRVDCFVVHSRHEIRAYSEWLGLPESRFRFVPLQRAFVERSHEENRADPFIVALGSAHRDYRTLVEAVRLTGHRTVIVCGPHAVAGLDLPANVTVLSNLDLDACHRLLQEARLSVTPVDNDRTASGQVTVIDAMMFGHAPIATDCVGTRDYIEHAVNGLLVPPGSVSALIEAIETLWNDTELRSGMGKAAMRYVKHDLSDEKTARTLAELLESF